MISLDEFLSRRDVSMYVKRDYIGKSDFTILCTHIKSYARDIK